MLRYSTTLTQYTPGTSIMSMAYVTSQKSGEITILTIANVVVIMIIVNIKKTSVVMKLVNANLHSRNDIMKIACHVSHQMPRAVMVLYQIYDRKLRLCIVTFKTIYVAYISS